MSTPADGAGVVDLVDLGDPGYLEEQRIDAHRDSGAIGVTYRDPRRLRDRTELCVSWVRGAGGQGSGDLSHPQPSRG